MLLQFAAHSQHQSCDVPFHSCCRTRMAVIASDVDAVSRERSRIAGRGGVDPSFVAIIYAGLREKDQTCAWLERSFADEGYYLPVYQRTRVWTSCAPTPDGSNSNGECGCRRKLPANQSSTPPYHTKIVHKGSK